VEGAGSGTRDQIVAENVGTGSLARNAGPQDDVPEG
jgi:hypothetical protein